MTDVKESFRLTTRVLDDEIVIVTNSAISLAYAVNDLKDVSEQMFKDLGTLKQVGLANGVAVATPRATPVGARAADSPPPAASSVPLCDKHHEPMQDLSGRGFKKRWYCSRPQDEAKEAKCWGKD